MGRIDYGYFIQSGKAVIDEPAAMWVRALFREYLAGLSLQEAGKKSGVNRCHSSLGLMLSDEKYLGDEFYPPIIEKDVFDQAQIERERRLKIHGRVKGPIKKERVIPLLRFHVPNIAQVFDDPFQQAEYAYSQIMSEEIAND